VDALYKSTFTTTTTTTTTTTQGIGIQVQKGVFCGLQNTQKCVSCGGSRPHWGAHNAPQSLGGHTPPHTPHSVQEGDAMADLCDRDLLPTVPTLSQHCRVGMTDAITTAGRPVSRDLGLVSQPTEARRNPFHPAAHGQVETRRGGYSDERDGIASHIIRPRQPRIKPSTLTYRLDRCQTAGWPLNIST